MLEGAAERMGEKEIAEAETTPISDPRRRLAVGAVPAILREMRTRTKKRKREAPDGVARSADHTGRTILQIGGIIATFNRGSESVLAAGGSDLSGEHQRTDGGTIFPSGNGPARYGERRQRGAAGDPGGRALQPDASRSSTRASRVKVELDIKTQFHDETDANGFNVIAEISRAPTWRRTKSSCSARTSTASAPGPAPPTTPPACAVMMEAMRILKTVGAKPRRTIRLALWGGEEQGLLGSAAYVQDAPRRSERRWPQAGAPEAVGVLQHRQRDRAHPRDLAAGQPGASPIFEQWIEPLRDLGVATLAPQSVAATDHSSFDASALPGFQFMQDRARDTTRAPTTRTWMSSTGSSAKTWCSTRPWSPPSPTTPPCATSSFPASRSRSPPSSSVRL